jgi:hypothetical protein
MRSACKILDGKPEDIWSKNGLTVLPPYCAYCLEIREPRGLCRVCLFFKSRFFGVCYTLVVIVKR